MNSLGAILGGVGLLSQMDSNRRAEGDAAAARAAQEALLQRKTKFFDMMLAMAKRYQGMGAFSPERRLAALSGDAARLLSKDRNNNLGAMMIQGYRPGDSEMGIRDDAVRAKYAEEFARRSEEIRREAMRDEFATFNSVSRQDLDDSLQYYGKQEGNALSRMQDPSGLLGSMLPHLEKAFQKGEKKKAPTTPAAPAPTGQFGYPAMPDLSLFNRKVPYDIGMHVFKPNIQRDFWSSIGKPRSSL